MLRRLGTVSHQITHHIRRRALFNGSRCAFSKLPGHQADPDSLQDLEKGGLDSLSLYLANMLEDDDDYQERLTKRQQSLWDRLTQNLPPQFAKLKAHVPPPHETVSNIGLLELRGRERELYDLHMSDPEEWTAAALGKKYKISRMRAQAVIMLQQQHEDRMAKGGQYYATEYDDVLNVDLDDIELDMSDYEYVDDANTESGDKVESKDGEAGDDDDDGDDDAEGDDTSELGGSLLASIIF